MNIWTRALGIVVTASVCTGAFGQKGGHGFSGGGGFIHRSGFPRGFNAHNGVGFGINFNGNRISPNYPALTVQPHGFRVGFRGGRGFVSSPVAGGHYGHSVINRTYENWSAHNYSGSHPAFGNCFNFTGNSDGMSKSWKHDCDRFGSPHVSFFNGNGWGSWGNHMRYGYFGWPGWNDSAFYFGFWQFSPFGGIPTAVSPFYGYPWLPPYVSISHVSTFGGKSWDWDRCSSYNYRPAFDNFGYGVPALNCAIGQLPQIFLGSGVDAIDFMISPTHMVDIFANNNYMYSVGGADFKRMLIDSCRGSHTGSFDITGVRTHGDCAYVQCRHVCDNPSGGQSTFDQSYCLQNVNGKYVITGFQSSTS